MSATTAAYAINGQPSTRSAFYAAACDPQRPIVVQACAGAGKTWMLVSRIVRALLAGSQPHEILAITFTKKAAGEMRDRLQEWLLEFSDADDEKLAQELVIRGISEEIACSHASDLRSLLSNLYQATLHNPRSVQIRTFHSWFAQLLRSAPLAIVQSLGLPSPYELLEDESQAVDELWPRFHALLLKDAALHQVYRDAVQADTRWSVETALENALKKRVEFELADKAGVVACSIAPFAQVFPDLAGLDEPLQKFAQDKDFLLRAAKLLAAASQKTYAAKGAELLEALEKEAWREVAICLLTQKDEPRKFSDKIAGIEEIRAAQELCVSVSQAQQQHAAWQHQQRMATLCRAMNSCFAEVKRERGWVDMGDLERAALHLLSDDALSGWVQQRLDAQIKHLLIDEFQDTNPLQWQALQTWLSGYAGAGGGNNGLAPSVFIVGDAKQSIYRFRRAEPQVFDAATRFVCEGLGGTLLSCDHTRRNAQGVMHVVNSLMTQASTELPYDFRTHTTESSEAGRVLRLPLVPRVEKPQASSELVWRDTLTQPRDDPEEHAVDTECALAARWLAAQISSGVPCKDIMVLARQRDRLSRMRDALRTLGIASQIAEKTPLIEQPEVQDVVALLDALVSPNNHLALARALKSPLFAWRDEDLMGLALAARSEQGMGKAWFDLLLNYEQYNQYLCVRDADLVSKTAQQLTQMQHWLQTLPPHDALSNMFDTYALVELFMAAAPAPLRGRVQLSLQALLHAALETKSGRFLTPHDWVRHLKKAYLITPQAAQPDAVRLMTIHGAKGLEAHTVLLLDTCTVAKNPKPLEVLVDWPGRASAPQIFAFLRSEGSAPQCVQQALAHEREQRAREEINALYVAMTRAKHQLVFSGHEMNKAADPLCPWMRLDALAQADAQAVEEVWHGDFAASAAQAHTSDSFLMKNMPPARIEYARVAMNSGAIEEAPPPELSAAARIGIAMHRLLELYQSHLDMAAFLPAVARKLNLDAQQSNQALQAAQTIQQGQGAWVWDSAQIDWQANEAELMHAGQLLRLDRLVKHAATQTWWVIDYKSNPAPQCVPELKNQLAQYQKAVQAAYVGSAVKAAFITAQGEWIEV